MKQLLLTFLFVFLTVPALAEEAPLDRSALHPVEAAKVCMVNNRYMGTEQIAVQVDDKTYYGCCKMCEARLQKDATLRAALDPVSGAEVDKALAVIGANDTGQVFYFENEENMEAFVVSSAPAGDTDAAVIVDDEKQGTE